MIVFATNNEHKLKEVRAILKDENIVSLKEMNINVDPDEVGSTYFENALIKAKEIAKHTNYPVLADDSGLEVYELNNLLGIYTSRFHNELVQKDRNKLVVSMLEGKENRNAAFVCCAVLIVKDKVYHYEYRCEGRITNKILGEKGFGYDPIFIPNGYEKTFALLEDEEKNRISHRGVAMRKLIDLVKEAKEEL